MDLDQEEYLMNILRNFKTTKACREMDHSNFNVLDEYLNVFGYLGNEDKRRPPFASSAADSAPPTLLYSQFMVDVDDNGCQNDLEYLFHPLNYKSQACEAGKCDWAYCPYYHSQAEREMVSKLVHSVKRIDVFHDLVNEMNTLKTVADTLQAFNQEETTPVKEEKEEKEQISPPKPRVQSFNLVGLADDDKDSNFLSRIPYNRYSKTNYHSKKPNKGKLMPNEKTNAKYYYGQEVSMFEDINHEFKNFSQLEVIGAKFRSKPSQTTSVASSIASVENYSLE